MSLEYFYTNESLDAVVRGMDVKSSDDIIAVCGAGCRAFAMLEKANSVVAVDYNEAQIEYAMKRAEALKAGDYDSFFPEVEEGRIALERDRNTAMEYFSRNTLFGRIFKSRTRLERIRNKLGRIEFKTASMQDFVKSMESRKYSKAYLSNALTFSKLFKNNQQGFIQRLAAKLRSPGLIYLADGYDISLKYACSIEEDKKLTEISLELERANSESDRYWRPSIWRKSIWRLKMNWALVLYFYSGLVTFAKGL
ncbi:MAG: class I SAM-dependent methyltransferase [Nanoarchaeota archaeon]